jgi:glucosamine kinase
VSDTESVTMAHHVAIDAGGTSTRAVVVDVTGRCLGHGRGGAGNPISSGWEAAVGSLADAVGQALSAASIPAYAIRSAVVAMAGGASATPPMRPVEGGPRPEPPAEAGGEDGIGNALLPLGVTAPVHVEADLLAQYFSGTPAAEGYALVAGTGAAAIRVEDGSITRVADGLGWLLGDAGSGFWIGREVVRSVLSAADGRGPATALTGLLLAETGIPHPATDARAVTRGLVDLLYSMRPVHLARFAPLAFAADEDDVAIGIVEGAANALTDTLTAVLTGDVDGPVVLGGSVLRHQPRVGDRVREHLAGLGRQGPVHVVPDGLLGAAVLALRRAGTTVDAAVFARADASLARLR